MKHFPSIFLSLLLPLAVAAQSVQIQDGAIRAEFSVSDSTKVYFSQGNLQYNPKKNIWRFAKHQFDIAGKDNEKISKKYNGWIDLFGWGTSGYNGKNPYMTSKESTDYGDGENDIAGTNYDWGVYNKISNGGKQTGMWRTLTHDEWGYLRFDRKNAGTLYGTAMVNGVNGCIFLPDNWTTPTGVTFKCGANGYSANTYSASDWSKMEANGAVFLPAAGYRGGSDVYNVGFNGYYWLSSYYGSIGASYLGLCGALVCRDRGCRYSGRSVRLVQDVPSLPLAVAAQSVRIQDGAIRAEFSVSDSTKVYFSQGNLRYQASTNTWRFAERQWYYGGMQLPADDPDALNDSYSIGGTVNDSDNAYTSENYAGWIDLFGWGTSGYNGKHPYMTSTHYSDYGDGTNDIAGTNYDWGVYDKISNGGNKAGMWRTLTRNEWDYILHGRPHCNNLYSKGCVDDINGLILLPDEWDYSIDFSPRSEEWETNYYSLDSWSIMESHGAVFLPAAGFRIGTEVFLDGFVCSYWSSSAGVDVNAYNMFCQVPFKNRVGAGYLYFGSEDDYVGTVGMTDGSREDGKSVRLVQDVK